MLYPETSLASWIQRWKLAPEVYKCPCCGVGFSTDIPVVTKNGAGLQSRVHDCGPEYWTAIMVPRSREALDLFADLAGTRVF